MNPMIVIQSQLLATKFYVPTSPRALIWRPRLSALLDESLKYPLTLVSAPAGFGKTMLLSAWTQALPASSPLVGWISLDEEDNDPLLFWTYVLSALDQQQPERFTPLLKSLQSPVDPPLTSVLTALLNSVQDSAEHLVLILDDYHVITEQQIHTTLWYLIEHLPPHFHLILATRVDPPIPLSLLRLRRQLLEVRTNQLLCTAEETKAFLHQAMGTRLADNTIQEVTARTEGWLVGLQLLALSLQGCANPATLLEETSGNQHYILDYLTQEVLRQQPQEVQTFLLSTCLLERLTASLCDAVTEQSNSQQMLEWLERANLFLTSLDNQRQWYRYHALFAEALSSQLEQMHAHLVPILHARASRWYAQHHQTTAAILHAFKAYEWQWAADLIEQAYPPLVSFTWGANRYALVQLRQWIERLPAEILACRPHLCLACVHLLWTITPHRLLFMWLDLAEAALRTWLKEQTLVEVSQANLTPQQEQRNLLGKVLTLRAYLWSYMADGQTAFALYEQALAHLSPENARFRAIVAIGKLYAYSSSSANDAVAAIENGYQAVLLAQEAKQPAVALSVMNTTVIHLIGAGRLHEAERLIQQALLLEPLSRNTRLPEVGWITVLQAEILRERNQLACAHSLATEAISLCEQSVSLISLSLLYSYHYPEVEKAPELARRSHPVDMKGGKEKNKRIGKEGAAMDTWTQEELGGADFGDKRLTKRFVKLVSDLAAKPKASIPQACEAWASTKAAYRFLNHENVTPEAIRSAHREKTVKRVKEYKTVLAIQDTTSLNYTMHQATSGLGPIDGNGSNGMHVHSVLATSSDGIPLGLVHQQVWSRDPEKKREKEEHKKLPIEEKESYRWLQSFEATSKAMDAETHIITVADREADIFELFALPRVSHMDLLIRAVQDRLVHVEETEVRKLWESVEALPIAEQLMTTHLEHRLGKPARDVRLAVRWRTVELLVPAKKKKKYEHTSVTFTALLVTEVDPPTGETPLEWLLLTTFSVETFQQAAQCVLWYRFRWLIERYHFVLKSGCHLEKLQLETAQRLERALALYCVVAWRLLHLTYLARVTPDTSCEVVFQTHEWQALHTFTHQTNVLPTTPPSLQEATRLVAKLGGFLARKSDGEPGVQTIWRGLRRLDDLATMWLLFHSFTSFPNPRSSG